MKIVTSDYMIEMDDILSAEFMPNRKGTLVATNEEAELGPTLYVTLKSDVNRLILNGKQAEEVWKEMKRCANLIYLPFLKNLPTSLQPPHEIRP